MWPIIALAAFIGCLVYRGFHDEKEIDPADGLLAPYKPHMSLLERWRDEERRMAEAEEAAAEEEEADEDPFCDEDDPPIVFCEEEEEPEADETEAAEDPYEEMPEAVCVFCGAAEKDDEDDAFCEKELSRLYKVRNGLEIKAARMLYVYQANDKSLSADARNKRMEKLESTKAWRGLQFDLNYINNEINGLEDYIKRG